MASSSYLARLFKKPLALLAIAWLLFVVLCAVAPGLISNLDPLDQDLLAVKQWPSAEHWLGTDMLGRDIVSRLAHGALSAVLGVLQALLVAALLSISIGVSAGYFRGTWDKWVTQYVNLMMSMPFIVTALAVLMVFGRSMMSAMVTFGVLASAGSIRMVRSVTLGVREELYIEAARISGLSDFAIITRHILPRIVGPTVVSLALFAAGESLGAKPETLLPAAAAFLMAGKTELYELDGRSAPVIDAVRVPPGKGGRNFAMKVMPALRAALTGLLVSPISWDHHWVWIAPGAVVASSQRPSSVQPRLMFATNASEGSRAGGAGPRPRALRRRPAGVDGGRRVSAARGGRHPRHLVGDRHVRRRLYAR